MMREAVKAPVAFRGESPSDHRHGKLEVTRIEPRS